MKPDLPAVVSRSFARVAVFVVVTSLSFYCSQESFNGAFFFKREDILYGHYWLLLSGHFSHANTSHLLLNVAAWTLVWIYGWSVCNGLIWSLLFSVSTLGTSLGLFFLLDIEWYSGLSGVLHGLLIAIVLLRLLKNRQDWSAWLLLLFIPAKLLYEYLSQAPFYTASLINIPVIDEAHFFGFISGIFCWLLIASSPAFFNRRKKAPA